MTRRIEGKYVHKIEDRNVLLSEISQGEDDPERFEAELVHDTDHPFFFEHPLDHVPAMFLVEAGRQFGIAISHVFLGVPIDAMFATRSFDIHFNEFAELHAPVTITAGVTDKQYRGDRLLHLRLDGEFFQNGKPLGGMGGSWSILPPEVWRRYRRREKTRLASAKT
jgi:hypothetical protein